MKRLLFYKQKSTVVYWAGEIKRSSQGTIILKAGMVFISGGGAAVVVFSWGDLFPLLPGN